jgi:hypothetical protein
VEETELDSWKRKKKEKKTLGVLQNRNDRRKWGKKEGSNPKAKPGYKKRRKKERN